MIITRAEFESNPSHYLDLVNEDEIIIIDDEQYIATLTSLKTSITDSLLGLIPCDVTDEGVKEARLKNQRWNR